MSAPSSDRESWQDVWNNAQPRISQIRSTINPRDSPDPRIIRVGQLDSELLDQELVQILQEPLTKALSLVNSSLRARFEPELTLFIQLTLYKLSIWNIGASYGAKLQDLRYTVPPSPGRSSSLSPSGLPRRVLLIHGTLTILVPYIHTRIRAHALSKAWPDAPSSDRRRKAWDILTSLESSYTLLGLLSFIAFLWDGRYRTIADRVLQMSLVPSRRLVKRDVSYEFMNRQMVWHAFTEFLLFLLPLVSARAIRRRLTRVVSRINLSKLPAFLSRTGSELKDVETTPKPIKRGKYYSLPKDQCAICAENVSYNLNLTDSANALTAFSLASNPPSQEDSTEPPAYPIYTPYILTSCGDVYCYHCIAERLMRAADDEDEEGWECLRCGQSTLGKGAERYVVPPDVGGSVSESGSDEYDEFSSDLSSMEESMGSYSYSDSGLSDE